MLFSQELLAKRSPQLGARNLLFSLLHIQGNSSFSPFNQSGRLYTPKPLRFKRTMSNFDAKNTIKSGKNCQKEKWFHFHACTGGGEDGSVFLGQGGEDGSKSLWIVKNYGGTKTPRFQAQFAFLARKGPLGLPCTKRGGVSQVKLSSERYLESA